MRMAGGRAVVGWIPGGGGKDWQEMRLTALGARENVVR